MVKDGVSGSWKKEVSLIRQAVRETMIDDGSDALAQHFSGSRFIGLIGWLGGAGMAPAPLASGPVPTGAPEPHRAPAAVAPQPQVQNPPSTPMKREQIESLPMSAMDLFGEGIFGISPSPTLAIPRAASSPSAIAASPAEVPAPAKQQKQKRGAKATDPSPHSVAKTSASKKGRPKRDPMTLLGTGLSELKASSGGSKLFSGERKNVARNWGNYLIDLKEMIDDEENAETLKKMKLVETLGMSARAVLQKLSVHGMAHPETLQAYAASGNTWYLTLLRPVLFLCTSSSRCMRRLLRRAGPLTCSGASCTIRFCSAWPRGQTLRSSRSGR